MVQFGAHMSIAGGPVRAIERGQSVGCDVVQVFTRNNNRWQAPALTADQVVAWQSAQQETGVHAVAAHGSYLINLATPDEALWQKSQKAARDELRRSKMLDIPGYVLHPGAHVGSGTDAGIRRVAEAVNRVLAETEETRLLLETTAGQGTSIGHTFEELATIGERVNQSQRLGFCLDTAHVFAAGYDLSTQEGYDITWRAFDRIIGLEHLDLIHLNDSKRELGSGVDRHEHIGRGMIGLAAFWRLANDSRLAGVSMVLETPKDVTLVQDKWSLDILRTLVGASRDEMQEIANEVVANGPG